MTRFNVSFFFKGREIMEMIALEICWNNQYGQLNSKQNILLLTCIKKYNGESLIGLSRGFYSVWYSLKQIIFTLHLNIFNPFQIRKKKNFNWDHMNMYLHDKCAADTDSPRKYQTAPTYMINQANMAAWVSNSPKCIKVLKLYTF